MCLSIFFQFVCIKYLINDCSGHKSIIEMCLDTFFEGIKEQ